ncbi:MAG: hypothetical protein JKX71_13640 [Amylibacter sp.]|nr:hypothetical protein [Amylibacter sp.]
MGFPSAAAVTSPDMTAALGVANAVVVVARTANANVDDTSKIERAGADIHRLAATVLRLAI